MTQATMTPQPAYEVMLPVPEPVPLDTSAAEARRRMQDENVSFLAVVNPTNGALLGVVLRSALERACEENGHDPESCALVRHLKVDVDFCLAEESVEEARRMDQESVSGDGIAARKARVRQSLPIIVVDEQKVPVGILMR